MSISSATSSRVKAKEQQPFSRAVSSAVRAAVSGLKTSSRRSRVRHALHRVGGQGVELGHAERLPGGGQSAGGGGPTQVNGDFWAIPRR
ncbi:MULTISPECIES: hypothetical protein [Streptosporangium]|uniref:Uncharacterized protein n=1 Tax=Streptosporangium brasiliense TaxID=47480 RepID=A0ABT9RIV0_9ACTN|nr:hypothetical protein [Streptosporangium brasiliense]MDP9869175.1 hypothetical protein [Streptosporangium brasiliense]